MFDNFWKLKCIASFSFFLKKACIWLCFPKAVLCSLLAECLSTGLTQTWPGRSRWYHPHLTFTMNWFLPAGWQGHLLRNLVLQPAVLGLCQQPWTCMGFFLWWPPVVCWDVLQALTELLGKSCPLTALYNCSVYLTASYSIAPKKKCIFSYWL